MFILNSNGDTTIKHFNLGLFYPVFVVRIYPNSKWHFLSSYLRLKKSFFSFHMTSLEWFFQIFMKDGESLKFKMYVWMTSANVTS